MVLLREQSGQCLTSLAGAHAAGAAARALRFADDCIIGVRGSVPHDLLDVFETQPLVFGLHLRPAAAAI